MNAAEPPETQRGMSFEEAVMLAREVQATPWYRVVSMQDATFYPGNWRLWVRYAPRRPNGTSDGVAVAKGIRSRAEWEAFQADAPERNKRNWRGAQTRYERQKAREERFHEDG